MYSYLRSQAGTSDPFCDDAEGILFHPAIDASVNETVRIQSHAIKFVTVDLALPTPSILDRLRSRVRDSPALAG